MAVVSSITKWAATSLGSTESGRFLRTTDPYNALRVANSRADPTAAPPVPPSSITPTAANCEAPVNTRADITTMRGKSKPAASANTPNVTPITPTTRLTTKQSRRRRRCAPSPVGSIFSVGGPAIVRPDHLGHTPSEYAKIQPCPKRSNRGHALDQAATG